MRIALVAIVFAAGTLFVACGGEGLEEPAPTQTSTVEQAQTADGGTTTKPTINWSYTNGGVTHEDTWNAQR